MEKNNNEKSETYLTLTTEKATEAVSTAMTNILTNVGGLDFLINTVMENCGLDLPVPFVELFYSMQKSLAQNTAELSEALYDIECERTNLVKV